MSIRLALGIAPNETLLNIIDPVATSDRLTDMDHRNDVIARLVRRFGRSRTLAALQQCAYNELDSRSLIPHEPAGLDLVRSMMYDVTSEKDSSREDHAPPDSKRGGGDGEPVPQ
jgi:hypothetical protein